MTDCLCTADRPCLGDPTANHPDAHQCPACLRLPVWADCIARVNA